MYTPLNPFYIEKMGNAGVYLFFLFLLQNIDCGYSLERVPTIYVLSKNKYQNFSAEKFQILKLKNLCLLHGHVFVMVCQWDVTCLCAYLSLCAKQNRCSYIVVSVFSLVYVGA